MIFAIVLIVIYYNRSVYFSYIIRVPNMDKINETILKECALCVMCGTNNLPYILHFMKNIYYMYINTPNIVKIGICCYLIFFLNVS